MIRFKSSKYKAGPPPSPPSVPDATNTDSAVSQLLAIALVRAMLTDEERGVVITSGDHVKIIVELMRDHGVVSVNTALGSSRYHVTSYDLNRMSDSTSYRIKTSHKEK